MAVYKDTKLTITKDRDISERWAALIKLLGLSPSYKDFKITLMALFGWPSLNWILVSLPPLVVGAIVHESLHFA